MARLMGPTGLKGIDVSTPQGTRAYSADRTGFINIENSADLRQAKAEGLVEAGLFSGVNNSKRNLCVGEGCMFNAAFPIFTCPKCGVENDLSS